jgi:uncharacterized protein YjbI with pentapeptide repeats
MGNEDHIARLKNGVAAWNAWRDRNRNIRPNLSGADLSEADLSGAQLVDSDLTGPDLTGCLIYGISAWDLKLEGDKQQNLVITRAAEPEITVDDIEVAHHLPNAS